MNSPGDFELGIAALCGAAGVVLAIFLIVREIWRAAAWLGRRLFRGRVRRKLRRAADRLPVANAMPDIAMRCGIGWPPCSHEDGWCTDQMPRGKHHAVWSVPLDDQPSDVILAVVTDVQKRGQS